MTKPTWKLGSLILYGAILGCLPGFATAADYWVTKTGNDSNDCTNNTSDACLTIQKGISLAGPGDRVLITEGTYIENSDSSQFTAACKWLDGDLVSICPRISGTPQDPILIQAAPGHEGKVIIDSQGERIGMHMQSFDYIEIRGLKFINNYIIGISSWGQPQNIVADEDLQSVGVIIEDCEVSNTWGPFGKNVSAIGMWGSKDWQVRNNYITQVSRGTSDDSSGIQAYGVMNALIENNYITNAGYGIFWKHHFVLDEQNRGWVDESEIRYNVINTSIHGVNISIMGENSTESGINHIHHNIIYGFSGSGIHGRTAGAYAVSGPFRIEHNIFHGQGSSSKGITLDAQKNSEIYGNIFLGSSLEIELILDSTTKAVQLVRSNHNIFDTSFRLIADRYSNEYSSKTISSLRDWQAATDASIFTLGFDNPDTQSVTASADSIFEDADNNIYTYSANSVANDFMPDGSNAGPYQTGNENIGLLNHWAGQKPRPPSEASLSTN
jgi:hypothetical protein